MEIVPILSTIILVGTVATFILAVAAYILYKMREGGAQEVEIQLERDPHHVVMAVNQAEMMYGGDSAPAEASMYYAPTNTTPPGDRFVEMNRTPGLAGQQSNENSDFQPIGDDQFQGQPLNAFFWEYSDEGFAPVNVRGAGNGSVNGKNDPGNGRARNQGDQRMSAIDPESE